MNQRGRVDQLAASGLGHVLCSVFPDVAPIWENGGRQITEFLASRYLPTQPIVSVQLGQLQIPIEVFEAFCRAVKLLPEGPRVGG